MSAFEGIVPRSAWSDIECRVARNVDRILEMYSEHGIKGTFFILGWVAEHYPEVVRRIADHGHEVASHGIEHERIFTMTEDRFRLEADRSRKLLEDVSGQRVTGYRAASWSIDRRTPWVHRVLKETGYAYSSSIYPIAHDHYGVPNAPTTPFYLRDLGFLEVPATALSMFGRNWPAAGGGYFRLLPYPVSKWMFHQATRRSHAPGVFYYHPWEIDPDQPRVAGLSRKTRFRHYVNLSRFERRLNAMLGAFRWGRMDAIYLQAST